MLTKVQISRILNAIFGLALIIVNIYASINPINGRRVGEGNGEPGALQPYGLAFSIWGLIYIFTLLFLGYQLLPSTYNLDYINKGITPFFVLQAIFNISWIFTQAYLLGDLYWIQLIIIYLLFITLLVMYIFVTKIIKRDLAEVVQSDDKYIINFIFGRFWLSVYLAWITGAICVDSFSVFADRSPTSYINASVVLGIIGLIAILVMAINRDVVFGITVVWTSSWVAYNYRKALDDIEAIERPLVITGISVASIVLLIALVVFGVNMIYLFRRISLKRRNNETESTQAFAEEII